jgi:hypothetical protein
LVGFILDLLFEIGIVEIKYMIFMMKTIALWVLTYGFTGSQSAIAPRPAAGN